MCLQEYIDGETENITKGPGKQTKCMARAHSFFLMVAATKVTINTTKNMVLALFAGKSFLFS